MENTTTNTKLDFLFGGGEMGQRIRNFDWSKTPLGNPETWESSLKTCVRIMLTSQQPMFIWWGDELINIYNDAYSALLGQKHPAALGISGKNVWKEIWDELTPRVETVFEKNEGTFDDALLLLMNRHGYEEETYFKFSYNPIPGTKKTTAGLFGVCTEETQRIINERTLHTLRKLGEIIYSEKSLDIIYRNVAEALANNNKDFPFALVYKITGDANLVTVAASTGIDKIQHVFPDTIDITQPTAVTRDFCEAFRENKIIVSEIKASHTTLPTGAWQTPPTQFVYLPIKAAGGSHPYCIIAAALNPYRKFDESYRHFCQLIAERISIEINKMLALEIENTRAEALAEIDSAKIVLLDSNLHNLFLEAPAIISLLRGPQHVYELVNNRYRELIGNRDIIGKTAREAFPELQELGLFELLDNVYATGENYIGNELHVNVDNGTGKLQDGYFNFVYQPTRNIEGEIDGILVYAVEVTEQVLARKKIEEDEKQQAFLLKLSDSLRPLGNPVDIEEAATKTAMDFMEADRCYYSTIEEDNVIILQDAFRGTLPSVAGVHSISGFALYKAVLNAGRPFVVDDVRTANILDEDLKQVCLQYQYGAFINIPIIKNGEPVGLFSLVQCEPRKWTDTEVKLTIETAERTWAAVERARADEKIKESEEQLELLIDALPVLVAYVDKNTSYRFNNKAYENWFGYSSKELTGKQLKDVLGVAAYENLKPKVDQVLSGKPVHFEMLVPYKDGGTRWVIADYIPHFGSNNEVLGFYAVVNDVTAIKNAETSSWKLASIVESSTDAIISKTLEGIVTSWNAGAEKMFGYSAAEMIGEPITKIFPSDRRDEESHIITQIKEGKKVDHFVTKRRTKEGKLIDISLTISPVKDSQGKIIGASKIARDITDEIKVRKKIKESEKKFEAAINAVQGIIWTNNEKGEMTGEQLGWANLTGQHFEEYQGYGWTKAIHPDDAEATIKAWKKAVTNRNTFEFEHRVKTKEDEWRVFLVKAVPAFAENGAIQQWVGVHTDITEKKLAEEKLAYRTALLEAHNEASIDGILLVDAKGKILSFNQRFVEIWNIPPNILNAKDDDVALSFAMTQLINPREFIDKVKYLYEHPTEKCLDELKFKDGKTIERNGYPVVGKDGTYYAWSWTFKDISKRKKIEQDLKNAKEQLELTFKNIPAGVYLIDAKGEMVYVNARGAAIYGDFTPEYILEQKDLPTLLKTADELFERFQENGEYFSPQHSPAYISLTTGKPSQTVLKQINRSTREQRWYYVQGAPLFDEKGKVSLVLITSTDITEQKNAEEKIKNSEERFRTLAQTLPQLVWVTDAAGNPEFASDRWKEYSGVEPKGEKEWRAIVHPDDYDSINESWLHSLTTGSIYIFDVRLKSKNGDYRWHTVKGEPVLDEDHKIVKWVGAFTDIHEQKLRDERKDEFISIASHEMKTPLTTAKAYLQMLELTLDERNEETILYAKKASESVNRLNELTSELLDVSKIRLGKLNYTITTFNFNELVDSSIENIQLTSPTHTIIKTGKIIDEVMGDKFRLQQVLINLLTNAVKYSPGAEKVLINLEQQNEVITVSVQDNGIGMGKESLNKIFDKYHRIEEHEVHFQGLGIGLYISYEIIQRHHGKLWAQSKPGEGSTFYFSIPVKHIEPIQ